jgi:hypothetical protein
MPPTAACHLLGFTSCTYRGIYFRINRRDDLRESTAEILICVYMYHLRVGETAAARGKHDVAPLRAVADSAEQPPGNIVHEDKVRARPIHRKTPDVAAREKGAATPDY